MKANDFRSKNAEELQSDLLDLRKEQFNLRIQRGTGQLENSARFAQVRKDIARIKTILNEKAGSQ